MANTFFELNLNNNETTPSFSFYVDTGKTQWFTENKDIEINDRNTQRDIFTNIKSQIKENTLFNITSLIFNLENNREETLRKYNCFYNPSLEALCIMLEDSTKYSDLSKEIVMKLMEFAEKNEFKKSYCYA